MSRAKSRGGALGEGEPADTAEQRHGNRPFPGSADAGVDGLERIFLLRESAVDRPVVDSAQYAHVEGAEHALSFSAFVVGHFGEFKLNLTPATNGQ